MAVLEVIALNAADVRNAEAGGADRVELVGTMADDGLSPEPATVEKVRLVSTLPVRPMLRLRAGFSTDGGEATRLKGLARSYLDAGADGVVLGFLNRLNQIDVGVVTELMADIDAPYTFHRAIDYCLDQDEAWNTIHQLPGRLTQVLTAGSTLGVEQGLNDLLDRANSFPEDRELIMAGGGLLPEHVPWLIRAGVRAFHIGSPARPGRSWKAYVDENLVLTWRHLLDDLERHES